MQDQARWAQLHKEFDTAYQLVETNRIEISNKFWQNKAGRHTQGGRRNFYLSPLRVVITLHYTSHLHITSLHIYTYTHSHIVIHTYT